MSKSKRSNSGDVEYGIGLWHPADERLDSSAWRPVFEKMAAAAEKAAADVSTASLPSRTQLERLLESNELLLTKIAAAIDDRPRRALTAILQDHLNNLSGKSFSTEGNRQWAAMFREFLLATGLRVACIGPNCASENVPSLLQYRATHDRHGEERLVFATDHYVAGNPTIRRHGGRNEIPPLRLVSFPPDLSFWRNQLGSEVEQRRISRARRRGDVS